MALTRLRIRPIVAALALIGAGAADARGGGVPLEVPRREARRLVSRRRGGAAGGERPVAPVGARGLAQEPRHVRGALPGRPLPPPRDLRQRGDRRRDAVPGAGLRRHRPGPIPRRLHPRRSTTSWPRSTPTAAGRNRTRPARATPATSRSTTTRWSTSWSSSATWRGPTTSGSSIARAARPPTGPSRRGSPASSSARSGSTAG